MVPSQLWTASWVFFAIIVLRRVMLLPLRLLMPCPVNCKTVTVFAVLSVIVLLVMVAVPQLLIPPPSPQEELPEIVVPFGPDRKTAAHLLPILLPNGVGRSRIMKKLRTAGIQSSIHYPPVHQFSYYRGRFPGVALPNTESFCSKELTLPLHPLLDERDVDRVVAVLKSAV